jgi:hypothetical protein
MPEIQEGSGALAWASGASVPRTSTRSARRSFEEMVRTFIPV